LPVHTGHGKPSLQADVIDRADAPEQREAFAVASEEHVLAVVD
jgi:hypothetical protein